MARLTDLADSALIRSFCSFPCIDEVRALPHVAGFPDLRVLRPAPTAARPPKPFPGFAGYRPGIASLAPQAIGVETALPGSHDDRSHVQRPIRRRVPQRPLLDQERLPWPSPCLHRLGTLSSRPKAGSLTTLTQASLTLQTARSLRPASHPTSRSRTGASLPGTQASPRTGLTPAGHRELVAPTSYGPPFPHDAGAVPAHASTRAAASPASAGLLPPDKPSHAGPLTPGHRESRQSPNAGWRNGVRNRSAAYAVRPGRSVAGAPNDELGTIVGGDWDVAGARLRLEPVVLINAIASQTPAIAGQGLSRSADRGGHRAKIGAIATRRLARRRSARCGPAQAGPRTARIVIDAMRLTESPARTAASAALSAEAVA